MPHHLMTVFPEITRQRLGNWVIIFIFFAGFTFAQDQETIDFYNGTKGTSIRALKDRLPPFVHLNDLLRAMGFTPAFLQEGVIRVQLNQRPLSMNTKAQSVTYTGITRPAGIRVISGEIYIQIRDMIPVFTELLGRQMVYEPVSKSLHIPADKTFSARVVTRSIGRDHQLEIVYSRATEAPKIERINRQLIIKVFESPISFDRQDLVLNDVIEGMELFERLPDGSTEILFRLGAAVQSHDVEAFNRRNPRTIIHFSGQFTQQATTSETPVVEEPVGLRRIVIDPGHGGKDRGAMGPTGLKEKDVTLDMARRLQRALNRAGNYEVRLTRAGDSSISLKARTGIANNFKADLFISLHLNAIPAHNARGSETYYLSLEEDQAFDAAHYNTDAMEEESQDEEADELELILWDMAQAKHLEDSFRFAKYVQDEFNSLAGIRSRGVKQAPMKVLKGAQMPAVLVEVAFVTNPEEERKLKSAAFREKIIRSMMNAILTFDREAQLRSKSATAGEEGH